MIKFFTHWTKKKIVICAISLVLSATIFFGAYTFLTPSGTTDVKPPEDTDTGTSVRPEGKTVADYINDPKQNLYIANGVLLEAGSFKSVSEGTTISTKAGLSIPQDILAIRVVKGSTVYKLSSSFGIVKMGDERMIHGDTYLYRTADKVNSLSDMTWPNKAPKTLDEEAFLNRYGCRGNGLTSYILNDETILEATYDGYDSDSGLYSFTYVLDNVKATAQLLYEMRTNSGAKNFSTFTKAVITVTMDKDWVVHTLTTDCAYDVPLMGTTPCTETMTEVFSEIGQINDYSQLPQYDYYSKYVDFSVVPPQDNTSDKPSDVKPAPTPSEPAEPTALDVLMNMFEGYLDGSPINAKVSTMLADMPINADITLNLDLANLANTTVALATDGGIKATYANEKVYLSVNEVKLFAELSETMQLVERLTGKSLELPDFSATDFDVSALLDGLKLTEENGKITISLQLQLNGMDITANILGTKNADGSYSLSEITASVNDISLKLAMQDTTVDVLDTTAAYVNACNVVGMVEKYIKGSPINAKVSTVFADMPINADITLNLDLANLTNTTVALATDGGIKATYANEKVYLSVNEVKLFAELSETMQLVERLTGKSLELPDFSATDFDVSALLDGLKLTEENGKITISLQLQLGGMDITANILGTQNADGSYSLSEITASVNDISLKLAMQDTTVDVLDTTAAYVNACNVVGMVEKYIKGAPINAKASTVLADMPINADITLNLDLANLANTTVALATEGGIKATYSNEKVYISVNEVKLFAELSETMQLVERLTGKSLELPDFSATDFDVSALLDGLKLTEEDGKITISLQLQLGGTDITANILGTQNADGSYSLSEITASVNNISLKLAMQDTTVDVLDTTASYINACDVISDYAEVIKGIIDVKSPEGNGQIANKSWTIGLEPVNITVDQTTYTTEAMTISLHLYQGRVVLTSDKLALTATAADGTQTTTSLSLSGAYLLPTETSDGKLLLTINDLVNPDSDIKLSISTQALVDCINNRLPELKDAIPQLKELLESDFDMTKLLDMSALLSHLSYDRDNNKTLSLTINAAQLFEGTGSWNITLSQPQDGQIRLSISQSQATSTTISNVAVSVKAEQDAPTEEVVNAAYDINAPHISLDSIDTLLQSLINTAKRTSFRLTGKVPVSLNAISIVKADITLDLDILIDVEKSEGNKDIVYIAAKLSRGEISGITTAAFDDYGGDSYLYYNGKEGTITLKRNSFNEHSWCTKCNAYDCNNIRHLLNRKNKIVLDMEYDNHCSYEETVTEQQFASDAFNYIMNLINFSSLVKDPIMDAINKESTAKYGIDDILVDYNYATPSYNVTIDLKPIDSVLGQAHVHIKHDENFNLSTLDGDVTLLDITGVSAKGTFEIALVESTYGQATELATTATLF